MEPTARTDRRARFFGLAITAFWASSFLFARLFLDRELQARLQTETWLKVLVAVLPVVPTAVVLWFLVKGIGSLDELHRRVHLEALAIAFPLAVLLLITLGLLDLAIELPPEDWSYRHVWVYLPLFYFGGLALAWRRYR